MPESTNQGIMFPLPGDLVRNPSVAAQLATDLGTIARTADDAIRAGDASVRGEVGTVRTDLVTLGEDMQAALDLQRDDFEAALDQIETAYDVAVADGYQGTPSEWLASLIGPRGEEGPYGGTAVTDPQVASYVTDGGTETSTALSAAFRPRGDLIVSPTDFGAVGDGVADDTAALNDAVAALADGATLWIPGGTYLITSTVTIPHQDVQVRGYGTIAAASDIEMLAVTGDRATLDGITVDGGQSAYRGVTITGAGSRITGCTLRGFHSEIRGVAALWCATKGGVTVENCNISDCYSIGDDTVGTANGASRGISLNATEAAEVPSIIRGNTLTNILGEEGDAIHVIFGNSTPFHESMAVVESNRIQGVTRRAIKVQAAGTVVRGNTYREILPPTNPAAVIGVVSSPRILVEDNVIDSPSMMGISIGGVDALDNAGAVVRDNILRGDGRVSTESGLSLAFCEGGVVEGNLISGWGYGITVTVGGRNLVRRNLLIDAGNVSQPVTIQASAPHCVVDGNVFGGHTAGHAISVNAPECVAVGNVAAGTAGLSLVRFQSTAVNGVAHGNVANGGQGTTRHSQAVGTVLGPDYKTSSSNAAPLMWEDAIPSDSQPSQTHVRGSVAWNRAIDGSGQPAGWICIGAGTPGVWQPFGTA